MTLVFGSTDDVPELADIIERRHAFEQDVHDEWWEGTYRIMTGPTKRHGVAVARLAAFLLPLADQLGLEVSAPLNIGLDKVDCRVPDIAVLRPDTPETSPAFYETAVLVVEVLSPREESRAKLGFYRIWGVNEYLEVDPQTNRIELLVLADGGVWVGEAFSSLGFTLLNGRLVSAHGSLELPVRPESKAEPPQRPPAQSWWHGDIAPEDEPGWA